MSKQVVSVADTVLNLIEFNDASAVFREHTLFPANEYEGESEGIDIVLPLLGSLGDIPRKSGLLYVIVAEHEADDLSELLIRALVLVIIALAVCALGHNDLKLTEYVAGTVLREYELRKILEELICMRQVHIVLNELVALVNIVLLIHKEDHLKILRRMIVSQLKGNVPDEFQRCFIVV